MRFATLALLFVALLLPVAPPAASAQDDAALLSVTLTTAPANLDMPETYRLRISATNSGPGLSSIGPVTDTLPPGTVFNGSTPAADCQPGCIGTTPATITWTNPCSTPLAPGANCNIQVNVTFPEAIFPSGTEVTNSFTAEATPAGGSPQSYGPATLTHPVTTFVPDPSASLTKRITSNSPNPPTLNQTFSYELEISNSGNVSLNNMVLIDTLPVEFTTLSVTTGAYSGLGDFAVGEGVRVSYEKNTAPGVFTLWGSSPNTSANTTLIAPPPGLGAGEYITRLRWQFGQALPGMTATVRPRLTGQVINPDNAGGPVAFGDTIQNCANLTAVYTAGPTNVSPGPDCASFTLSAPFVQLNPALDLLSAGPFRPGEALSWRLRVRSDARSSDPLPLEDLDVTWLLPAELEPDSWSFDAQGSGLPAPQSFEQIPDFAGSGRTLLRWRWNPGNDSLAAGQEGRINVNTSISATAGPSTIDTELTLEHDSPGLGLRCTGSSRSDSLDLDEDGDSSETVCYSGVSFQVTTPDLELALDDGGLSAAPGDLVVYSLSYRNTGARDASGVELRAEVPDGASFDAAGSPGWSCTDGSPAGTPCTLTVGALEAGGDGSAAFAVRVNDPAPVAATELRLAAEIADDGANGLDPSPENNAAVETTPLDTSLTFTLTKEATPTVALPGQPITYTLSFGVAGDIVAAEVLISDTIPAELTGASFSSSLPVSDSGAQPGFLWEVGDLAPGASGVITVSGVIDPDLATDTTITNRAEIGGLRGNTPLSAEDAADIDVRLPRVRLEATSIVVDEAAGLATVAVELDQPNPYRAISVAYAITGGTASEGADYEPAEGVLTFPAGSTRQTIRISIIDDEDDEPDELLEISLSAPDGALLGTVTTASLRIEDNDVPPQRIYLPLVGNRTP